MRPVSRARARREALAVALVDAAEKTIADEGLQGLNARDLARHVGCALGAIYNVFPDLDAIVHEVNARTLAAFEGFVAERGRPAAGKRRGHRAAIAELVDLAEAYLDFAAANQPRWRAVFEHHIAAPAAAPPDWYRDDQRRMFSLVERPLAALRPDLDDDERMLFARTMFSAVHGIVVFGLDEKLISIPVAVLGEQVRMFVTTLADGLITGGSRP